MQRRTAWIRVAAALFGIAWGANHFTPLLLVYRSELKLPDSAITGIFGIYAVGLVPALILSGRAADRYGRRAVLRPATLVSVLASVVLMIGPVWWPLLYVGRLLAGMASGAACSAGTAWVSELSAPGLGARRSAAALSLGFGVGPLLAGALAQWLPLPTEVSYVVHLALMAGVIILAWRVPETAPASRRTERSRWVPRPAVSRHFLLGVVPWAPWVFGTVAISIATLPALLANHSGGPISAPVAFSGLLGGLTLPLGALVQPIARRLAQAGHLHAPVAGLLLASLGLAGAAVVAWRPDIPLIVATAVVLGAGYGVLMVTGLARVELLAERHEFAGLVSIFYALAYLGFGAPYLVAALAGGVAYARWLGVAAFVALATIPVMMLGGRPVRRIMVRRSEQPGVSSREAGERAEVVRPVGGREG
ncbi:MFS transporter [Pseudonocardia yunnanensis]|uniref:MFS transporter n=1 Tax=Pseudonocardia yunnanensis TaxID=58107 RepID=A0ABW4F6Z1_9PSEU